MKSFYARLLLWFCIANVVTLLISVGITQHLARRAYLSEPDWAALASAADQAYIEGGVRGLRRWHEHLRDDGVEARLYEDGRDLMGPPQPPPLEGGRPPPDLPRPLLPLLPRLLASPSVVLRPRPEWIIAGQRVVGSDGVPRQLVALRMPRPHEHLHVLLTIQIALSLMVIVVLGWLLARGIARPVRALSAATRRMAAGELSARVDTAWTRGRDELGALARDFNTMADRIEALVTHERGVLQDISHELRSPLARLQLHMELARRAAGDGLPQLDRAEREIVRLDRLLTEMLALTRLEAGLPGMRRETCDLAALARARATEAEPELADAHLRARVEAAGTLPVSGSPVLLERALDNLIGNAIKYAHGDEGAAKTLEIGVARAGDDVLLRVRDHGPGVAEADLASLFRPFFRGRNAGGHDGQGLGLAIVARIAQAHGGKALAANAPGGGLEIVLRLPLTRAE